MKSWTEPGDGFLQLERYLSEAQPVANVSVSGMSSSDAKKLGKELPKLIKSISGKVSSKAKGAEKRVSVKGNTVFISDPGSGSDTFQFETMLRAALKTLNMKGKVASATHRQR